MSEARQRRAYGEAAALEEAEGLRRTAERDRAALDAARAAGHNPWPTDEDRARAAQGAAPAAPFDLRGLGDEPAERAALRASLDARAAAEGDRALAAADLDRADRAVAALAADLGAFADLDAQLIEHEQRVIVTGIAADVPHTLAAAQRERAYLSDRLDRARQVRDRLAAAVAAADAPLAVARAAAAQAAARVLTARAVVRAEELRAVEQAAAQLRGELFALSTCWLGAEGVPPRPAPLPPVVFDLLRNPPANASPAANGTPDDRARWRLAYAALLADPDTPQP